MINAWILRLLFSTSNSIPPYIDLCDVTASNHRNDIIKISIARSDNSYRATIVFTKNQVFCSIFKVIIS